MSDAQHTPSNGSATETPAQAYERFLVPAIFLPWSHELLVRAAPQPGERVLDIACGTGIVVRTVAPLVGPSGRVVAQDISPAMLSVARSLPQPPGATIEWQEGSAEAEIFPQGTFDLITCQQGFQFFPDRPAALAQMRRVLVTAGRLVLAVWRSPEHNPVQAAVNASTERRLGATQAPSRRFSLGDAGDLRDLLEGAGFRDVSINPVVKTIRFASRDTFVQQSLIASSAVLPELGKLDNADRSTLAAAIQGDVAPTLDEYADGDGLTFPMVAHIARAVV